MIAALYPHSSWPSKTIVKRNLPSGRTLDRVQERWKELQPYTSSLIMDGLAGWSRIWKEHKWKISVTKVWGKGL